MSFKAYDVEDVFKIKKLYTLFEDSFPGGYQFSGEAHDFWECVYVKEGTATICASDKIYNLEKGDIIFINHWNSTNTLLTSIPLQTFLYSHFLSKEKTHHFSMTRFLNLIKSSKTSYCSFFHFYMKNVVLIQFPLSMFLKFLV